MPALGLLINIIIVLVVVGVVLYMVNAYIPMQPPIPAIINIVVALFLLLWVLRVLGFGFSNSGFH